MTPEQPTPIFEKNNDPETRKALQDAINSAVEQSPTPFSESQEEDIKKLKPSKNQEHFFNIISKAPEEYSKEEIIQGYKNKEDSLYQELNHLKDYITAKETAGKLEYQIHEDNFREQKNRMSPQDKEKKISILDQYNQIIKFFEGAEDPREVFEHAKESLEKVEKKIKMFGDLSKNAQNYPFQN